MRFPDQLLFSTTDSELFFCSEISTLFQLFSSDLMSPAISIWFGYSWLSLKTKMVANCLSCTVALAFNYYYSLPSKVNKIGKWYQLEIRIHCIFMSIKSIIKAEWTDETISFQERKERSNLMQSNNN